MPRKTASRDQVTVIEKSRKLVPADSGRASGSTRREFLGKAAGATLAAGVVTVAPVAGSKSLQAEAQIETQSDIGPSTGRKRAKQAFNLRVEAAQRERQRPIIDHPTNGDEELYSNKIGSYSKGLPHNALGEVDPAAYASLIRALSSGSPADFEALTLGGGVKQTNPQAGLAFDMEGPDSHCLAMRPAPAFSSAEEASEIAENYWMALLRDVPFTRYDTNNLAGQAASDLSRFSDFRGPKSGGRVTGQTLFRGEGPGTLVGPYISQFMWLKTPFGAEEINRQMRTPLPGSDFLTTYADWLLIQNGGPAPLNQFDAVPRYVRNGRDLGEWVHIDVLFQGYLEALLILFSIGAPVDGGNPYRTSRTQIGFGTLGDPFMASVLCAVATRALKAVWYQKWFVHRRLRPEEFAGRAHNVVSRTASYPVHSDLLVSPVLDRLFSNNGSYLLPMAFPEGCPTHPAYGAGHATVAGACVTVLKAFFDESFVIPNPVVASEDGLSLLPYSGPPLTVGGELNKLANNVAIGRNIAGVHWRSDGTESLTLGEEIVLRYLKEEKMCLNEQFNGFSLTKFDGTMVTV